MLGQWSRPRPRLLLPSPAAPAYTSAQSEEWTASLLYSWFNAFNTHFQPQVCIGKITIKDSMHPTKHPLQHQAHLSNHT